MLAKEATKEVAMRKALVMYYTGVAAMLMGAILFAPRAQAMILAAPTGLKAAIQEEKSAQEAACRRGRDCSYTSSSNRQSNASGDTPYFQKRYTGPSQYQQYPWGNPYGSR
jgi:hypothetical protein